MNPPTGAQPQLSRPAEPENRMTGSAGYADVLPFLHDHSDWWELRSQLEKLPRLGLPNGGHPIVSAWYRDGCPKLRGTQYAQYAWELDAWTEYWDVYRPETGGRYYFGSADHPGYLNRFLPNPSGRRSPVFDSWKAVALDTRETPDFSLEERFAQSVRDPEVTEAVLAVDELVRRIVSNHFNDGSGRLDALAYLDAMERFGRDTLPENPERYALIPDDDPRKSSALHHTIEGDIMWFAWALHLECAELVAPADPQGQAVRRLLMAGTALGCAFDSAFRHGYRTRKEYQSADDGAWSRIWARARLCAASFAAGSREMRELFRIRTFGDG